MLPATQAQLDAAAASRLRRLNVIVGSVHALQAVVLLAIATAASLPVTASFLVGPPGAGDYGSASLGSVRIDWLVAAFLLLAAIDHLTLTGRRPRRWYEANVARGINPARWWEYSLSASLMVVLIAMLAGVSELVALIALFGANAAMILFGLVQEQTNVDRDEVDWRPFIYGASSAPCRGSRSPPSSSSPRPTATASPASSSRSSSPCSCSSTPSRSTCGCSTAGAAAGRTRRSPSAST